MPAVDRAAPTRSLDQRLSALETAQHYRMFRAEQKRDLKKLGRDDAQAKVAGLLVETPKQMATMKVLDLLLAVPTIGRAKGNRILIRLRISPSKHLSGLTARQRNELIRELAA